MHSEKGKDVVIAKKRKVTNLYCSLPLSRIQALPGGDEGIRTLDLCVANAPLSHLSYIPTVKLNILYIRLNVFFQ